jgi:hypothetical protein
VSNGFDRHKNEFLSIIAEVVYVKLIGDVIAKDVASDFSSHLIGMHYLFRGINFRVM